MAPRRRRAAHHRQWHPEQKERQAAGNAAYWDSFWDAEQVFYGQVLGFKGLERRAVVLVVNESRQFEPSRERLYVGLSRARDQLVVCGDPDFIREVGGPDLARRLNVSPNVRWRVARAKPHHRAVTLAASCSAILTAESPGLALHVLMSMMTLFRCASARPQPQPGAPASC